MTAARRPRRWGQVAGGSAGGLAAIAGTAAASTTAAIAAGELARAGSVEQPLSAGALGVLSFQKQTSHLGSNWL